MTTTISVFDFNDAPVRVSIDAEGEPWFAAVDVCRILDIQNPTHAIRDLDKDEKITLANSEGNPRAGIPLQLRAISESGLYQLIFKSRKPEAKAFQRWVTRQVLPSIRKTGFYAGSNGLGEILELLTESVPRLSTPQIRRALVGLAVALQRGADSFASAIPHWLSSEPNQIVAVVAKLGPGSWRATDVCAKARECGAFPEVWSLESEQARKVTIGRRFMRYEGRVFAGLRLEFRGHGRHKRYLISRCEQPAQLSDSLAQ